MGRLKLAGLIGARLVLWAVSLQRRPGAALAFPARQWRPHDRGAAPATRRGSWSHADRALGRRALSPGQDCPGGREGLEHQADAAAGLQPGSDARGGAVALAAGGRHLSPLSCQCHASADDLTQRVADFEMRLNREPFVVADRLWVKDTLDPDEEKLRLSK